MKPRWTTCGQGALRFTRKSNTMQAILLAWPEAGFLDIPELGCHRAVGPVTDVTLLGHEGELRWGQDSSEHGALRVLLPEARPRDNAWVLRIGF